ncbi:MAG: type II toxin-antitoxin system HicB family antitoxin [Bacteroidales bacterium]|nr:type II toxin-antitoxin system HicB family antitoxin [Bacteroidales bacterium]
MEYTVVLEKMDNGWWFCQCEQIPEAVTQGETIEEAKENIKEAIDWFWQQKRNSLANSLQDIVFYVAKSQFFNEMFGTCEVFSREWLFPVQRRK